MSFPEPGSDAVGAPPPLRSVPAPGGATTPAEAPGTCLAEDLGLPMTGPTTAARIVACTAAALALAAVTAGVALWPKVSHAMSRSISRSTTTAASAVPSR